MLTCFSSHYVPLLSPVDVEDTRKKAPQVVIVAIPTSDPWGVIF